MKLTQVALKDLKLDGRNARKHSKRNLETIGGSLAAFGQVENLVVQKSTMKVIGGNGRVEAMRDKGDTHAHVLLVDVNDSQAAKLGLALNRTAELAEWDTRQLAETAAWLNELGVETADIGFDDTELASFLGKDDASLVLDDGQEYDESIGDDVKHIECPHCGGKFLK